MSVRPKTRPSNGVVDNSPSEELYCGYVMHQQKSVSPKMRWGQLWTSELDNGVKRCDIRLFKYDIVSPKPGTFTKKDLRLKLSFQFTEEDFCGLEKGEHYMKGGMRRYICVILKDRHLIVQDAITAMTDTDHNVLGTWYTKITEAMCYISRWQIFEASNDSADMRYFHASRLNMCECYSLHNSHAGRKGKILLDKLYKSNSIVVIDEVSEIHGNGKQCTRVTFYDKNYSADVKMSVLVHGTMKLSEILARIGRETQQIRPTLCSGFDDLNVGPNLVKIPPEKRKDSPARSLRDLSGSERTSFNNVYISQDESDAKNNRYSHPTATTSGQGASSSLFSQRSINSTPWHNQDLSNDHSHRNEHGASHQIDPNSFAPTNPFVNSGPRHHNTNRPPMPPPNDSHDPKKMFDPSSQISVDSDYLTDENFSVKTFQSGLSDANVELSRNQNDAIRITGRENTDISERPYINIANQPDASFNATRTGNVLHISESNNMGAGVSDTTPPLLPPRDSTFSENVQDLIREAIIQQNLPPTDNHSNDYINSMRIEMTIAILLNDVHSDVARASLDLSYDNYMSLVLGLEMESAAQSDWRGLASELGYSFRDVGVIESAVQTYKLSPAQIVLLHWYRTQSPHPFTRAVLKKILLHVLRRLDLAALIAVEDVQSDTDKKDTDCSEC